MDEITREIAALTLRVWVYRHVRRGLIMPMQLKGLRAKASMFRSALDAVGQEYDAASDVAKGHAADVRSLAAEFHDMKSDLDFAIGEVGNSSAVTGIEQTAPVSTPADASAIHVEPAQPLRAVDLARPNDPPSFAMGAQPAQSPVMNHTPMARTVPSRRDL
jgi:hypothetical protein